MYLTFFILLLFNKVESFIFQKWEVTMTKTTDTLELYLKFMSGERLSKAQIGDVIGKKSDRTVQRYIAHLNDFFANRTDMAHLKITMNTTDRKYEMVHNSSETFDKTQVLAILKILISTRGLSEDELQMIVNNLTKHMSDENQRVIEKAIQSELVHYEPMNHGEPLLNKVWDLNHIIQQNRVIEFNYFNAMNKGRTHVIKPMYITFSELYFYLVGVNDKEQVLIFRIDRIQEYKVLNTKFNVPNSPYIREGALKQRIYFMYGGHWKKVSFEFNGGIIESVLDRFPTAQLLKKDYTNNRFVVEIEVIGDGILMWLLSQGSRIKVLSPNSLKEKHIAEIEKILGNYR